MMIHLRNKPDYLPGLRLSNTRAMSTILTIFLKFVEILFKKVFYPLK